MKLVKHIRHNVRRLRLESGLSQARLAKAAGVSRQTITGIELGLKDQENPSLNIVEKIAGALEVSLVDLLKEPGIVTVDSRVDRDGVG